MVIKNNDNTVLLMYTPGDARGQSYLVHFGTTPKGTRTSIFELHILFSFLTHYLMDPWHFIHCILNNRESRISVS